MWSAERKQNKTRMWIYIFQNMHQPKGHPIAQQHWVCFYSYPLRGQFGEQTCLQRFIWCISGFTQRTVSEWAAQRTPAVTALPSEAALNTSWNPLGAVFVSNVAGNMMQGKRIGVLCPWTAMLLCGSLPCQPCSELVSSYFSATLSCPEHHVGVRCLLL